MTITPSTKLMKKILSLHTNKDAVTTYRLHRFLDNIPNKVTKQDYINKKRMTIGEIADNLKKKGDVWVCKYLPNSEDSKSNMINILLNAKRVAGTKLVMDIDDNIWKIPMSNPTFWAFKEHEGALSFLTGNVDYVTCSTEPLANYLKKFNKNVKVFKNVIDPKDWKLEKKKRNKKIRIGWVFSATHIGDIRTCDAALEEIMEEYKGKVEFVLIGGAKKLFNFNYKFTLGRNFEQYPALLEEVNLDIAICPLHNNEFNQSKSNIKWLECSMAGAAVVASKVYPYENSIKNGKTGFVVGSKNQWKNALKKLIESKELRDTIVDNARKEILENYNIEKEAIKYNEFIESL